MVETEVKLAVADPKHIREKLLAAGAVPERERLFEENVLYDTAGGDLKAAGAALRLRTVGKKSRVTFKGPTQKARSFKVREEYETGVHDGGQMRKILKSLGFRPVIRYAKHRTAFRKGRLKICLDETAAGVFLELEGRRHEIVRFARVLGYSRKDFITLDYVRLLGLDQSSSSDSSDSAAGSSTSSSPE